MTPLDGSPQLLVADGMGIRVVEDDSVTAQFLAGRAVTLAVPDRRGGVVFQTNVHEPTGLHWDDALGRNVLEWANGGPDPIESIAAPLADHQPVDLITHPDARLTLVDVVDIDGRPFVLYRRYMGGPGGHPGDSPWDIVLDYLCLYDLTDGDTEVLGLLGAYESSLNEMRIGGDLVALAHTPYGEGTTRVGVVPFSALFADLEGDWLPTVVMEHLDYGPGDCSGGGGCDTWAVATAARDGSRVVWVEGGRDWDAAGAGTPRRQTLVAVDPATGVEQLRFDLGVESDPDGDPADRPGFIDDDGRTIVVSGVGPDRRVLIVTEGGTVGTLGLDGATVSLWDAGAGGPMADEIVLRGDGLGLVDFGTPTDEALSILEAVLGPADRTSDHFFSWRYWDDVGFSVAVDDRPFYRDDGAEHFVAWGVWGEEAGTFRSSGGVGVGSTFDQLVAAHGARVTEPIHQDECIGAWHAWLDDPGPEIDRRIMVVFDADPQDGGRIRSLSAGAGEGC